MAVYIITHKAFNKLSEKGYKTLLVGANKGHIFGDCFDDEGDNISEKNKYYCELTGLYWIWKNVKDDYIGIVHYRRYFSRSLKKTKLLSEEEIKHKLRKYDIILPNRVNLFQPVEKQFSKMYVSDPNILKLIRESVFEKSPEYIKYYDDVMSGWDVYFCNMMICSKELFDNYCEWLFSILFVLECKVDMTMYDNYQKRLFGFVSERLLKVWVEKNNLSVCELGMVNIEKSDGVKKDFLKALRRVYSYYFSENKLMRLIIDRVRESMITKS